MTTNTFNSQTARVLAAVATCMPPLQGDVMQGWIDNPNALKKALAEALCSQDVETSKVYLRQLYAGEKIVIGPTDGTQTIAQANDVFTWGIYDDFKHFGLDVPAQATEATNVTVHEMIEDGIFTGIYGSIGQHLEQFCFTQAQIIAFCESHKDKLRQGGYGTFFLFKVGDEYFVADAKVKSDGRLFSYVHRFSCSRPWLAECRHRFVFPQLEPSVA